MDQDKRIHPRHGCVGEAGIHIHPELAVVRGRILDISAGGCKIEFQSSLELEIGQKVELIFSINNLPFHVLAAVRGARGGTKFGFEFLQLRERVRAQLEDLIDEVKSASNKAQKEITGAPPRAAAAMAAKVPSRFEGLL